MSKSWYSILTYDAASLLYFRSNLGANMSECLWVNQSCLVGLANTFMWVISRRQLYSTSEVSSLGPKYRRQLSRAATHLRCRIARNRWWWRWRWRLQVKQLPPTKLFFKHFFFKFWRKKNSRANPSNRISKFLKNCCKKFLKFFWSNL